MKTLSITAFTAAFLPSVLISPSFDHLGLTKLDATVEDIAPLEPIVSDGISLQAESAPEPIETVSPAPSIAASKPVDEDLKCLALNIYHEARSEPISGQIAVAKVTLNRVRSKAFPGSVCDVVKQGGQKRHRCQFSWWCDGKSDDPTEQQAWQRSLEIGQRVLANQTTDPTRGALYYHADYVKPRWARQFQRTAEIGRHLFYRPTRS
jgi:spore germination cell wall hydrolase CwlJ-like protein